MYGDLDTDKHMDDLHHEHYGKRDQLFEVVYRKEPTEFWKSYNDEYVSYAKATDAQMMLETQGYHARIINEDGDEV